jgi:hypothetical protein
VGNNAWDQTSINVRERPLSSDVNGEASQINRTLRELLRYLLAGRASNSVLTNAPATGFLGDSFRVGPESPAAMGVVVRAGYGFMDNLSDVAADIGGCLNLNDLSAYKPMFLGTSQSLTVPAADPSNPRIDIVEVKYDRRLTDNTSRDVLNTGTGAFDPTLVNKTLAWIQDGRTSLNGSASINYKTGTPAGVPAAPSTSAGYVKIAEILVDAAATSIAENKIKDTRSLLFPNGGFGRVTGRIRLAMTGSPPAVTLDYLNAPPGVSVAFTTGYAGAGFARFATAYVIGGNITRVSAVAQATEEAGAAYALNTELRSCEVNSSVFTIDSGSQTALAAATVPAAVAAAIGQKAAIASFYPKKFDGTTVAQPTSGTMTIDFAIDFQTT